MVPEWYTDLPTDDDMIFSSGAATAPDLQLAVDIATLNAKAKLADRIDGRLDSMTKSLVSKVGDTVDASVITELERVSKNVIAEVDVAGYSRKELDVIASGNQYMAFVLLEYSDREATKVYTNRLRKYKMFSDNLWDEFYGNSDKKGFVELVDAVGDDLTVVNSARVSFDKESEWHYDEEAMSRIKGSNWQADRLRDEFKTLCEADKKLINYLAEHKHWTPFAHPQITLRIKAPISIRTQFFKHKQGFVENEISRRYVSFEPDFYLPQWRGKPKGSAKQGSDEFIAIKGDNIRSYGNSIELALYTYNQLIEEGVAPEQARFVLPQAMYTEWYWTGSLAAYARFYSQRIDEHAQWEIREYARVIGNIIEPLFPHSWRCLTK